VSCLVCLGNRINKIPDYRLDIMVATFRRRAGFIVSNKSEEQMTKEDIRNRQACSMRYRRDVKVSIKQAPWEGKEDEQRTSRKSR